MSDNFKIIYTGRKVQITLSEEAFRDVYSAAEASGWLSGASEAWITLDAAMKALGGPLHDRSSPDPS